MKRPSVPRELDVDLDHLSGSGTSPETVRQVRGSGGREDDSFSSDVFADRTSEVPRVDLDVGEPLSGDDGDTAHRRTLAGADVGLSEPVPVTMSEVGTKLDLARAYMDMGDPDGARSILEEVLSGGQRQPEAGSAAPDGVDQITRIASAWSTTAACSAAGSRRRMHWGSRRSSRRRCPRSRIIPSKSRRLAGLMPACTRRCRSFTSIHRQ